MTSRSARSSIELVVAQHRHADRAVALEEDPLGHRPRDHVEVGTIRDGVQERVGGRAPQSVALGQLEASDALLAGAVEVGVALMAGLGRRLDHHVNQRLHRARLGYRQRAAGAVEGILSALVVLGAAEEGQHVLVAPALRAVRRPLVVVSAVAADVDHRVDRAATAQHAPAREVEPPTVKARLGLAEQVPVKAGFEYGRKGRGGLDLELAVAAARLDHRDRDVSVLGEAGREHASGGSGADDHVVIGVPLSRHGSRPSSPRADARSRRRSPRGRAPAETRG